MITPQRKQRRLARFHLNLKGGASRTVPLAQAFELPRPQKTTGFLFFPGRHQVARIVGSCHVPSSDYQ